MIRHFYMFRTTLKEHSIKRNQSPSSDTYMKNSGRAEAQPTRSSDEPTPVSHLSHFRSLSVDADFFAGLDFGGDNGQAAVEPAGIVGPRHRHSNSMDGSSTTTSFEAVDSTKKAMAPDKLAELALIDPKRAKRILANRQSAARSKERKTRYTGELERKVQTLQGEATTLSAQVTKLQRDTSGLTTENKELSLRLQAMEQEAHLRDALNDALREELKRLKIAAGEVQVDNGSNVQLHPQFSSQRLPFNTFNSAQTQYAQQQQQERQRPRPTSGNTDPRGQLRPNFSGFNQRA
ncbi:hypothetical protein Leryth_023533 [Lithospermum erythrorhizon]|nr:hypothetical protein Leryth_023533 [Lithospermum erythrorhizon]